jgi:hypothetical protein
MKKLSAPCSKAQPLTKTVRAACSLATGVVRARRPEGPRNSSSR